MKYALAWIASFALLGCSTESGPEVTAYVSLDEMFSKPILQDFEKANGIKVHAAQDTEATKTVGHKSKLIALKDRQEADVFWNNEIMNTILLKRAGVLAPYVPSTAADIPAQYRDPDGMWVGFAARARVILINTDLVKPGEEPTSIYDFLKPEWKNRFSVARPLFGTTATHAAALFAHLGPDKAMALMKGWVDNGCRIEMGNAQARNAVRDGNKAACLTDTDDANGALLQGAPVKMIYPDQGEGQMGTLIIPNTVMLIQGGPNPEAGRKLVDYVASREVEARLAKIKGAQMPLRSGIEPYSRDFDFARVRGMKVDWEKVTDQMEPCTRFVEEVFGK